MELSASQLRLSLDGGLTPYGKAASNFTLPPGQCTALVGENGAGKTTLLHSLLGTQPLYEGSLRLGDESLDQARLRLRHTLFGFVSQESSFPAWMPVRTFLSLVNADARGASAAPAEFASGLLPQLDRCLGTLSSGERQRTFLARALLQNPQWLMLDEPTNHLDPLARRLFVELLRSALAKKTSAIISTHDVDLLKSCCSHAIGMRKGVVVFAGPTPELFSPEIQTRIFGQVVWS